jgi:site-specific DNA recombinase
LRADGLEAAVWEQVRHVLEEPERLRVEYQRRLNGSVGAPPEEGQFSSQLQQLRQGLERLIDSYAEGLIAKEEFERKCQNSVQGWCWCRSSVMLTAIQSSLSKEY